MGSKNSVPPWTTLDNVDNPLVDCVYVCLACGTTIGPVWDDYENKCPCDVYDFEVIRVPVKHALICETLTRVTCGNRRTCNPEKCPTARRQTQERTTA